MAVDSLSVKERNLIIVRLRKVNNVWRMNHFQKLCITSIDILVQTAFATANQQGTMKTFEVNLKKYIIILNVDK